jgi:hypothetical protein
MQRLTVAGLASVLALAGTWYWASPHFALRSLRNAAAAGDPVSLAELVDMGAARVQLRVKMMAAGSAGRQPSIEMVLVAATMEARLSQALSASSIHSLLESGSFPQTASGLPVRNKQVGEWVIDRRGLDTFLAHPESGEPRPPELVFHRIWFGWRLVALNGDVGLYEAGMPADREPQMAAPDPTRDLVLDFPRQRQDRRTLPNGAEFFGASGSITNVGYRTAAVPALQIALIDADGRVVLRLDVRPAKTSLGPGESVTVNEAVVDVPRSAVTAEFSLKLPADSPSGNTRKVNLNAGGL